MSSPAALQVLEAEFKFDVSLLRRRPWECHGRTSVRIWQLVFAEVILYPELCDIVQFEYKFLRLQCNVAGLAAGIALQSREKSAGQYSTDDDDRSEHKTFFQP